MNQKGNMMRYLIALMCFFYLAKCPMPDMTLTIIGSDNKTGL